jgi:hypothetical protein
MADTQQADDRAEDAKNDAAELQRDAADAHNAKANKIEEDGD